MDRLIPKRTPSPDKTRAEDICLTCGLCCNGVIFANVRLQPEDDPESLKALGLPLAPVSKPRNASGADSSAPVQFRQPCAAFDGCSCRIYSERPSHCRKFQCILLQGVRSRQKSVEAALRIIRTARRRARKVQGLLQELGEVETDPPLAVRVRTTVRRLERTDCENATAEILGQLTVAFHRLNKLLSQEFYRDTL